MKNILSVKYDQLQQCLHNSFRLDISDSRTSHFPNFGQFWRTYCKSITASRFTRNSDILRSVERTILVFDWHIALKYRVKKMRTRSPSECNLDSSYCQMRYRSSNSTEKHRDRFFEANMRAMSFPFRATSQNSIRSQTNLVSLNKPTNIHLFTTIVHKWNSLRLLNACIYMHTHKYNLGINLQRQDSKRTQKLAPWGSSIDYSRLRRQLSLRMRVILPLCIYYTYSTIHTRTSAYALTSLRF